MKQILKHLPGQHNQKRHGSRYSSFGQVKRSIRALRDDPESLTKYRETVRAKLNAKPNYKVLSEDDVERIKKKYNLRGNCYDSEGFKNLDCKALEQYTWSDYVSINDYLRKGIKDRYEPEQTTADKIAQLDNLMNRVGSVPEDILVYRGGGNTGKKLFDSLEPGDSFIDKGFVSTSTKFETAESPTFAKQSRTVIEIRVPKGAKGVLADDMSNYPEEHELLLARDSKFKVIDKVYSSYSSGNYTANRLIVEVQK